MHMHKQSQRICSADGDVHDSPQIATETPLTSKDRSCHSLCYSEKGARRELSLVAAFRCHFGMHQWMVRG